ncbi:MAG: hypothetical protein F4X11_25530 [Acidobacteria bacterium]|nr:hypothetical protein [Acidobacteriota bacterium]
MLYTYAIEPEALATWDRCRLILNLMGFQHGRAIAAYPTRQRWKALVRAACRENDDLGDRDQRRILRKLEQSNGRLVRPDVEYDDGLEPAAERWIRNAVDRQITQSAFHAILSTRNPTNHPDVVLDEDIDESHDRFDVPRELPVLRQAQELAAHIATLVVNSREMLLVDPHLDFSKDKWRPVVAACLDLIARSVRGNPRAEIHTLDTDAKWSSEEFRKRCRRHIPGMLTAALTSVQVRRWRLRDNEPHDFHARYMLTDRGGYRLDKGLDEQPGVEQPVGLLDDQEWNRIREGYSDATPVYDRADAFTVDRSGTLHLEPDA